MANPAKFIREVRQETAKVTWPTRKETLVSTAMVLVLTIIAAVFFLIVDNVIGWAVQFILGLGA
ncbi:MAG: preprotein translocase subunit SecE [Rickettsiales bacterium]|nr:preprotein translocase subunit SecE [Rickettsiales bacterium]|tara:strand:- start:175 stop:366 length:192 start_codon:yes stop_codon:yes gene_type:complete